MSDITNTMPGVAGSKKDYHLFQLEDFANHVGKPVDTIIEDTAMQFFYDDDYFENRAKRREKARELIEHYLLPLNRQHALINVSGTFGVADFRSLTTPTSYNPKIERAWIPRSMPEMSSLTDFAVKYENQSCTVMVKDKDKSKYVQRKVTDVWRKWSYRREYMRGFLLAPDIDQKDLPESYNTWRGWGLDVDPQEPPHPVAWETLRKHFEEAYFQGRKRELEWFYSWLADLFQNPMSKPGSSIILRGKKGTGKTLLADIMKKLIGAQYFARLDKPSQLTGQFNGHLLSTLLVDVEEAFFSGDKAAEGTIKSWITSEDVQIRLMRTDGFMAKNFSRFMFTSNEKWVVPVSDDERRFFVIDVSDRFLGNDKHFELLWTELEHAGGFREFFKFLLTWKKPDWVKLNQPPKTEALARQFEESLTIPERFFWNAVKMGEDYPLPEGGEIYRSQIKQQYAEWMQKFGTNWQATNDKLFTDLCEKFWEAEAVGRKKIARTDNKGTVYLLPSLNDLRAILTDKFSLHDDAFDCDDEGEED
ncbi:primase-helicase family protein [Siccirubricoccus phaeus]|uniref:primase-helicase family protein n=1 Tax=Siccirubricoccus phaeus TaxID=2595053 RepID=UPI0011F3CE21|nr:DUF5906 domain-containing protein [Siccirubricoccus phaeus]